MRKRRLGRRGLEVSALGLDCRGLTPCYGTWNETDAAAVIDRALQLGCTFFDASQACDPQANEAVLGRCLDGRREGVAIATQVTYVGGGGAEAADRRPAHLRQAVEASLRRLNTDRIELLIVEPVDGLPVEHAAGMVRDLIGEGKVLHFGLRTTSEALLRRAHGVQPVTALQADYSLWERGLEERMLSVLFDLNIGLVPGPATGLATERAWGEWRDSDSAARIEAVLSDIAAAHAATPSQVALAWLLGVSTTFAPSTGSGYHDDIDANFASLGLVLSAGEIQTLDDVGVTHAGMEASGHIPALAGS